YTKLAQEILDSSKQITVVQRSLNLYDSRPRFDGQDYPEACPGEPASPTNVLTELIAAAKHRGVDAKVILDIGEGDTGGDSLSNAKKLDAMGITVLEDSKTVQTHAKLVLIDDDTVVLGSTNWTWPALETGNETSVMLKNSVLNNTYLKYVDNTVTSGTVYTGLNDSIWRDAEFK
ncbi:MAG: phospholipase D-like domain-containing protein, partial [Candidatus Sumerlaeales bacterium]|nr:phospholipase D-like domain-containing protein [Candidatus Sumerlaeales bacterium]